MCISLPGKIVKIEGNEVIVDYGELGQSSAQNLINAKSGEYVYVTQGFVTDKLSESEALEILGQ
jgi:hydrogenase assembly chaperone HypC/HupF